MSQIQWDPNPPYGERSSYRKLTVTIPQDVYQKLIEESARRKIEGKRNQMLSELLREALCGYLEQLNAVPEPGGAVVSAAAGQGDEPPKEPFVSN
ncbi:MAG TPA: hypothetical protein VGL82_21640 [Bryobacteraceae bacterium]|jgi:transcriptional regulator of met regulon